MCNVFCWTVFFKQTDRYKSYWQSLQALITITGRFSLRHETEQRALVFFAQQNKRWIGSDCCERDSQLNIAVCRYFTDYILSIWQQ